MLWRKGYTHIVVLVIIAIVAITAVVAWVVVRPDLAAQNSTTANANTNTSTRSASCAAWEAGDCEMAISPGFFYSTDLGGCSYSSATSGCTAPSFTTLEACLTTCTGDSTNTTTNSSTVNTNTTITNTTTNTGSPLCSIDTQCTAFCAKTGPTCGDGQTLVSQCTAGSCDCVCITNGSEDTITSSVQLHNGSVSTNCTQDSECVIVNNEVDYTGCYPDYCGPWDYALDKYVAVNNASFTDFVRRINNYYQSGSCGVQPACPQTLQPVEHPYLAQCQQGRCQKVTSNP